MPVLWRQLDIDSNDTLTNIITTMDESTRSPGVHVRDVCIGPSVSDSELLALIQHTPLLVNLLLPFAHNITDTSFQHVPAHCPHLSTLYLYYSKITHVSMAPLGQHCHQLSVFEFNNCYWPDIDLFDALHACPLQRIALENCEMDRLLDPTLAVEAASRLARCQTLTTLFLRDNYNEYDYTPFISTTNTIKAWPHLTHLCLAPCIALDGTTAIPFIRTHAALQYLELSHSKITDHTLDAITTYLPNIKELSVTHNVQLTAPGLLRLVKRCAHLEERIQCWGCQIHVSDDDIPDDVDCDLHLSYTGNPLDGTLGWLARRRI